MSLPLMTYQKRLYINLIVQNRGVFGRFSGDSSPAYRNLLKKMRVLSEKECGVSFGFIFYSREVSPISAISIQLGTTR